MLKSVALGLIASTLNRITWLKLDYGRSNVNRRACLFEMRIPLQYSRVVT